jgi:hypothetical protein
MKSTDPLGISRAPFKVDEIGRLKKGFWLELRPEIQVFPSGPRMGTLVKVDKVDRSGNPNFRMETRLGFKKGISPVIKKTHAF